MVRDIRAVLRSNLARLSILGLVVVRVSRRRDDRDKQAILEVADADHNAARYRSFAVFGIATTSGTA